MMMRQVIFLVPILLFPAIWGHEAYVHITGQLFCNGTPYQHEKVTLWEKNYVFADSFGAKTKTDPNGYFELKATLNDAMYFPKPYFYMINWCMEKQWWNDDNGDKLVCSDSLKVFIPAQYINNGSTAIIKWEMNRVELTQVETQFAGLEAVLKGVLGQKGECRRILKEDRKDTPI
ncbi:hypothetical protein L5515_009881 [Caenorhabditis briggsae]|uniref:Uncharacterized protein n=1 Tax=Caenorhabditis briggsae TaxID=6238 RepID=A0AAE9JP94_CAEBR|nr:hypothetical protein L5515_009881 [Caenorhabditis briggsae]